MELILPIFHNTRSINTRMFIQVQLLIIQKYCQKPNKKKYYYIP